MKTFQRIASALFLTTALGLASCVKDHPDSNLVSRKGLSLSPAQEVPAVTNSTATGTADVSFDKTTKILTYTVNWTNLTGVPTGAHIHGTAPRGRNAPIKHDFTTPLPKTVSGTFTHSVLVDGVAIKQDSLLMGFYYFNLHTSTNRGGEIRGQIEF